MKKNDTVRMKFNDGETIVSGTWKTKSNATTITLDEFKVDGETVKDAVTLTVVIDEKDSAPKPKKQGEVSNIFEMTEQDFEAIEERFSTAFGK